MLLFLTNTINNYFTIILILYLFFGRTLLEIDINYRKLLNNHKFWKLKYKIFNYTNFVILKLDKNPEKIRTVIMDSNGYNNTASNLFQNILTHAYSITNMSDKKNLLLNL